MTAKYRKQELPIVYRTHAGRLQTWVIHHATPARLYVAPLHAQTPGGDRLWIDREPLETSGSAPGGWSLAPPSAPLADVWRSAVAACRKLVTAGDDEPADTQSDNEAEAAGDVDNEAEANDEAAPGLRCDGHVRRFRLAD